MKPEFGNFKPFPKRKDYHMAKKELDKKTLRKKARKDIEARIGVALADLKADLGEKKFKEGLKKASKAFFVKVKKAIPVKSKAAKTKLSAKKLSAVVAAPVK